jgi:hypothetical protein
MKRIVGKWIPFRGDRRLDIGDKITIEIDATIVNISRTGHFFFINIDGCECDEHINETKDHLLWIDFAITRTYRRMGLKKSYEEMFNSIFGPGAYVATE